MADVFGCLIRVDYVDCKLNLDLCVLVFGVESCFTFPRLSVVGFRFIGRQHNSGTNGRIRLEQVAVFARSSD